MVHKLTINEEGDLTGFPNVWKPVYGMLITGEKFVGYLQHNEDMGMCFWSNLGTHWWTIECDEGEIWKEIEHDAPWTEYGHDAPDRPMINDPVELKTGDHRRLLVRLGYIDGPGSTLVWKEESKGSPFMLLPVVGEHKWRYYDDNWEE
jgi:hypothetical protein